MSTTKIPVETDSLTLDLNVIRNPNKTRQLLTTDNVGITQDQNLRYNIQYITIPRRNTPRIRTAYMNRHQISLTLSRSNSPAEIPTSVDTKLIEQKLTNIVRQYRIVIN